MPSQVLYFLQVVRARAYVRVVGAQRELSWIVGDTLLPLMMVTAFIYVYKAMNAPPEYTGFVVLGGILMTFWLHVLWSMALQLFWEKEMGNLERYLMTPMARPALLVGMAVGGMVMTGSRALIIYLTARFVFDVRFPVPDPWLAAMIFALTMIALYGLGGALSSLFFIAGRGIMHGLQTLQEPVYFLGGFYFPVKHLGMIAATVAATLIPVAIGLDALRQTMLGAYSTGFIAPSIALVWLAVMGIIFNLLSVIALRRMEDMGRRDGKLFLKNQ